MHRTFRNYALYGFLMNRTPASFRTVTGKHSQENSRTSKVQADLRDGQDVQVERGSRHTKRVSFPFLFLSISSDSFSQMIKLEMDLSRED